jgi:hypothetical protein
MLKTLSKDIIHYTPISDRESEKPTVINFRRMSKGVFDEYMASVTVVKGTKITRAPADVSKKLFEMCLAKDDNGVYIENAQLDGVVMEKITELNVAVQFLLGLDVFTAGEIEDEMRGQNTLTPDEEKN